MIFITSLVLSYLKNILIKLFKKNDIKKQQYFYKNNILDKNISKQNTINTINTINTLEKPCTINILDNKDLYCEYKKFRYLNTFPKKWLHIIDKYDSVGVNCANCLFYCSIKHNDNLPLFLGFCEGCFMHFTIKDTCDFEDKCENCTSSDDCYYCETCTTNVIDFSKDIINTLYYHKNNKKKLINLILKLNNEYGNLNVK